MATQYAAPLNTVQCAACPSKVPPSVGVHIFRYERYTGETYCSRCWDNILEPVILNTCGALRAARPAPPPETQ